MGRITLGDHLPSRHLNQVVIRERRIRMKEVTFKVEAIIPDVPNPDKYIQEMLDSFTEYLVAMEFILTSTEIIFKESKNGRVR